ncbi:MAG: hypothetical protein K8T25_15295 [Planctomycetia bacterium]|nr:hypothetical protein [Planctomycetia bacterium]
MCRAISILKSRINLELLEEYNLRSRIHLRSDGAGEEIIFDFADRQNEPQLPVIHAGQMLIYEWGNRGGKLPKLPKTGWCRDESLKAGKWRWMSPEPVIIPAQFGMEKGIWFVVTEGIRGIVVRDQAERPHVYMLTQNASTYFQNMTKHDRMPVLVGEQI